MTTERIDTVNGYFEKVTRVNFWSSLLFWATIFCSFIIFFTSKVPNINSTLNIIYIVITVIYCFISNWLSLFMLREAQSRRRVHLLSDSLGVRLDDEETNLYYNNSQIPSVSRLGVNVFENTLFTWRVTEEMAKRERIKVSLYLLIWLIIVLNRNIDLNFISIIAQTIFTTGLIINHIKLEILRNSCSQLFKEFRQFFLTNGLSTNDQFSAVLLNVVFRYETVVASMGVHLSSKVFHKINPTVSIEWETIKENLGI